jgi:hypothetical protein
MGEPQELGVAALTTMLELAVAARTDEDRESAVKTALLLADHLTGDQINEAVDQALDGIIASRKEQE